MGLQSVTPSACHMSFVSEAPERVVSWVYNSNTRKQHRDVAFYGVKPDFNKVKQPYKNQNDKRIRKLMAAVRRRWPAPSLVFRSSDTR